MICLAAKNFRIKTSTEAKKIIKGTKIKIEDPKRAKVLISRGLVKPVDGTSLKLQRKIKTWGCQNCDWHFQGDDGIHLCLVVTPSVMRCVVIRYLKGCPQRNKQIFEAVTRGDHLAWMERH